MKMPKMAAGPKTSAPKAIGGGGGKPHIRMRKLKAAGGASAFPTAPVAFPGPADGGMAPSGGPPMPMPPTGAAGPGAGPGDMGQ